jgi:hypothetical protein
MNLNILLASQGNSLSPPWRRIQRELFMCFEENYENNILDIYSLTEPNDGKNLCRISLRWKSTFTQHLEEKQRKLFYFYLSCWKQLQRNHLSAFSDILPLLFSFYFTPIAFVNIDLVVYYPLKYPFEPPRIDILSPVNEMTRKITTSTRRYKGSTLTTEFSPSMTLWKYLIHLESDILRQDIEIHCPLYFASSPNTLLLNLILRINPFSFSLFSLPDYVAERFLLYCRDSYGILAGFDSEDVFILKENYINIEDMIMRPIVEVGIDSDCVIIPLLCLQSAQSSEFLKKVKKHKLNLKDIYIDGC